MPLLFLNIPHQNIKILHPISIAQASLAQHWAASGFIPILLIPYLCRHYKNYFMENYDSEDERKLQKSLEKNLQKTRAFFADKETLKFLNDELQEISAKVTDINIRARRGEDISEEDQQFLSDGEKMFRKLLDSFSDMKLILEDSVWKQSVGYFYHIKELAENGNEDAKKIYEEIAPKFREALMEGQEEGLN
jgi:hypothetical protein